MLDDRGEAPSSRRSTRPYARASSGSNDRTVAATPSRRWTPTSSRSRSEVSSGVSPERTRTSSARPSRAPRAQRTASPVPRGSSWTATGIPSNAVAVRGEATTTSSRAPTPCAAANTQSTMRRPRIPWRCLGTSERMRVPSPAAITTAPKLLSPFDDTEAGAPGFEPGITGPKPVALPLGHAPEQAHLASGGRSSRTGRVTNVCPRAENVVAARAASCSALVQAVHRRTGARHVRSKRARMLELARQLRGREIVSRERGEIGGVAIRPTVCSTASARPSNPSGPTLSSKAS